MPATEVKYHKWTLSEKHLLRDCDEGEVRKFAEFMKLPYTSVYAQWRLLRENNEKLAALAIFDYSKIVPLKALFVRCPVCGGTTTVDKNAYCRSCLSQWHPITLEPLTRLIKNQIAWLHDADPW